MTETLLAPPRVDLKSAASGIGRLLKDKDDTEAVFVIMRALSGKAVQKGYARLMRTARGGQIAYERAELQPLLDDHAALRQLPDGSVGRAYLDFVEARAFSADGLADESRKVAHNEIDARHPVAWYARRLRDIHDLWHVLTGYSTDALGEVCVVAFSYAQTRSSGFALIALAGGRELARGLPGYPVRKAVWQAWQAGRKAAWLPGEDYVTLLAEPLEAARARLNLQAPHHYLAIPAELRNRIGVHAEM
jgi:ubiquinone biosynthesis protein COQ4